MASSMDVEVIDPGDIIEREVTSSAGGSALGLREEIDIQIATAKRYPRDVARFQRDVETLATIDEATAGACIYTLPRAGKNITGPSVRLAEIVYSCWGNLSCATRVVEIGDRFVRCQSAVWDLERNIRFTGEVMRRITDKTGKRYNDDMIQVTIQATQAIAFRAAIFRVVPRAVWKAAEDKIRHVIAGDERTLAARRVAALEHLRKQGIAEERVLGRLGRAGVEAVTVDDLIVLRGILTAVKQGDATLEAAFPPPPAPAPFGPAEVVERVVGRMASSLRREHKPTSAKPKTADAAAAGDDEPQTASQTDPPYKTGDTRCPPSGLPLVHDDPEKSPPAQDPQPAPVQSNEADQTATSDALDDTDDAARRAELFARWAELRDALDPAQIRKLRLRTKIRYVTPDVPTDDLELVVNSAVEMLREQEGS